MKRFVVSLLTSILAFTAGLITASSWTSRGETHQPVIVSLSKPCPPNQPPPPAPEQPYSGSNVSEFEFGQNGLRLVPEEVRLKSDNLMYDIDVTYPQILNSPYGNRNKIRKVNQHLKDAATNLYQWALNRSGRESYLDGRAGTRNTVNFTYQIGMATDSVLGITFVGYSYDGEASTRLHDSFSVNYDLTAGKNIKLSELFKPGSAYLDFISRYSTDELSKHNTRSVVAEALSPRAENFQNWQITSNGIMFTFYVCKVVDCAEGDQSVHIMFDSLRPFLNPNVPERFTISYP